MFTKPQPNTLSVKTISNNKPLLIKIALLLAAIFTIFGASPALAVNSIDIIHHAQTAQNEVQSSIDYTNDYNHNNIPDDEEREDGENENQTNESQAKVRNHEWYKKDRSSDNGIEKAQTYKYFHHKTAEEIYELKPGGI